MSFGFEKLRVWQEALSLASEVRALARNFPNEERYVLTSQFIRAVDSISLNISEGSGGTKAEFKNFLRIANRSLLECVNCLYIARNEKYLSDDDFQLFYGNFVSLLKQIQALRNTI